MSYVNKKTRLFLDRSVVKLERRRSESRLKEYLSSIDARAWCDAVEDRRQHIIELVNKEIQKVKFQYKNRKLIPLEVKIDLLMASKDADICKLKRCLFELWKFIEGVNLSADQKGNMAAMKQQLDTTCIEALSQPPSDEVPKTRGKARPTSASGGSYKVTASGPGRVSTRIKGVRPGAQISTGKRVGSITTRAQGASRVKTTFKNVYPEGQQGGTSKANTGGGSSDQGGSASRRRPSQEEGNRDSRTLFLDRGDMKFEKRRSEARLKQYPSAIDARAWCAIVEDRRQHIIELIAKGAEKCSGGLIPIEVIIDTLLSGKNADISKLKGCLAQLWSFIEGINLSSGDKEKLASMRQKMDPICTGTADESKSVCPAKPRHDREKAEVEGLTKTGADGLPGTYKVTAQGPGKVTIRIKGIQPGFQIAPGKTSGSITTRAQGSSKVKTTIKNVYPDGTVKVKVEERQDILVTTAEGKGASKSEPLVGLGQVETILSDKEKLVREAKEEMSAFDRGTGGITSDGTAEKRVRISTSKLEIKAVADTIDTAIDFDDPVGSINKLRDELMARENLCNELQADMACLKLERDDLKDKLTKCLQDLENVKRSGVGDTALPLSCEEEISELETEMEVMRSGNLSPEQEAEIIKKEVDMLKKYCMKLRSIEDENERLRSQVAISRPGSDVKFSREGLATKDAIEDENQKLKMEVMSKEKISHMEELSNKLENLEDIIKERDELANKVRKLEKELLQYRDLPDDVDIYRDNSKILDDALDDRDKMTKRIDQMKDLENELNHLRKKAARVDELEQELKFYTRGDTNAGVELIKAKSKCLCLERELQNVKMERDSMSKRIEHMKKEIDTLKSKGKEAEMLRLERDKLQIKQNEMSHIQIQHENLQLKCKCLENAAKERDSYKQKYDEILAMECQCQVLRSQVDTARDLARERDGLVKQVKDLESCICEQEGEIKKLVSTIDDLNRNKHESQSRMKDALSSMRAEVEKKDNLIAASEEKLAAVQSQLKSSIQGVSCETTSYKTRIDDLEKELTHSQSQIKTLQKQLKDSNTSLKSTKELTKSEVDSVAAMKRELEAAKAENTKLQEIANKMVALTGDEHVQNMLKQSECAVKRVVEELSKQYKEWDHLRDSQRKGKGCLCKKRGSESNVKFKEELEDIHREKEKLEKLVKEIQNDKSSSDSQKELVSLRVQNSNLEEQLQNETKRRKDLEKMLNNMKK